MKTVILDNENLCITVAPGDTDTAVVTFSGIGLALGRTPQEEFVKTLDGATHTQFFVIDKARSWYNATSSQIIATLTPLVSRYRKVVTLGNSMGGFGAIYFASRLPNCRKAISFVPQFSVDPAVAPWEMRWRKLRSEIRGWTVSHAMEQVSADVDILLFFGSQELRDQRHLTLFQQHATERTAIFSLDDTKHGSAQYLKQMGRLQALLDLIIVKDRDAERIDRFLTRHEIAHTFWTRSAASQQ